MRKAGQMCLRKKVTSSRIWRGVERIGNCVLMVNKLAIKSIKKNLEYDLLRYKLYIDRKMMYFHLYPDNFVYFYTTLLL